MKLSFFHFATLLTFCILVSSQNLEFTQQPDSVYYTHTNAPLVIQCNSTGAMITYRRNNAPVGTTLSNEPYTQGSPVENTDGSAEGVVWDCEASNDDGAIVSSRAIVFWAKFEDTSSTSPVPVTLRDTVNAYLPCDFFDGSLPPPVIGWDKNGVEIPNPKILPGSNSLLLEAFDAVSNDRYSCVLLNRYGVISRVTANTEYQLTVVNENTFTLPFLAYPSGDFVRTIGDVIHFECVAYQGSCYWQRDIDGGNSERIAGSTPYTSNLFTVTVTKDSPTLYRAFLAGDVQETRTLTIYQQPEVISSLEENGELIEYEQQDISISCQSSGVPDPTVDLYKDNVLIQNNTNKYTLSVTGNTTTLQIQNLANEDTGYYTCRADNSEASAAASGRITVRVAVAPSFSQQPTPNSISSITGSEFSLNCTTEGDPLPEIEWYFSSPTEALTLTNSTSSKHTIIEFIDQTNSFRTSMLTVSDVTARDNGDYMCVGTNFKATTDSQVSTVLIPNPPVIGSIFLQNSVMIFEGETFSQDCVAYAQPTPTVTWSSTAKGQITTNSSDHTLYPNDTLVVTANRQNSGTVFTCTATNGQDTTSSFFTIIVNSCAIIMISPDGPLNSVEHVNATLTCTASGSPTPTSEWFYRPSGTTQLGSLPGSHTGVTLLDEYTVELRFISMENAGSYCCRGYTDELNDTCGYEIVCVDIEYTKDCDGLYFCIFELWQLIVIVVAAFILILLLACGLFFLVYLIIHHYQSHTYDINRAVGLSLPYTKERRDDDSDDDGEFDPTYESLPANKSAHPPVYKQAPYYNGGGDSGLPSYNPPPQAGADTTSLPLDGLLGPPPLAYPPPIDMHHASMPMLLGNFAQAPEMYAHEYMHPEMYPGDMMKPQPEEFLSTDGQFV